MEPRPPTLVALADVGYAFSDRTLWYYRRSSPPLPPLIVDAIAAVAVIAVAVIVVLLAVFFL